MQINYTSNPIPVKPYVKQFIEAGNEIKPFVLKNIYAMFGKDNGILNPTLFDSDYPSTIKFPLPETVFLRNGFTLTRKNIDLFNATLEGYIKMLFECELEANIRRSIKEEKKFAIQEMIIDLRQQFGLDDENFPFETIKKSLQRFCIRENIDLQAIKIFGKSVPKKRHKVAISSHHISRSDFLSKFNISARTYSRMKNEKGNLSIVKKSHEDYINIVLSELPPIYNIIYTE